MADGLLTTLLENIRNNLRDTTNFSSLSHLKQVEIAQELMPLPKISIYALIIPGGTADEEQGVAGLMWWQGIDIYLVARRMPTRAGTTQILGTATINGLETVAKDTRQALCRSDPYNPAPSGSGYATQTGVLNTRFELLEFPGKEEFEDWGDVQICHLKIAYLCVDTRAV